MLVILTPISLATHASTNGTVQAGISSARILMAPLMETRLEKRLPSPEMAKQSLLVLLKATAMEQMQAIRASIAGTVRHGQR